MRYTREQMARIRSEVIRCGLDVGKSFLALPLDTLREICNGVGADDSPRWVRDILTWIYREYQASAAIHDCDYFAGSDAEDGRLTADRRFRNNCLLEWADCFGTMRWLRPRALWDRNKIRLAYNALRLFGESAWRAAKQDGGND